MNPTDTPNDTPTSGRKRTASIGLAAGLLAGGAIGLVATMPSLTSAASDDSAVVALQEDTTEESGESVDVATDAPEDRPEAGERLREVLQPLVDDGTITTEQADAVTAQLVENRPDRGEFGEGRGPGGHRGGPGMFARGVASEALTDLLGIDAQELRTQLRDGATLAEIATAQGVEVQAVVDELVAELDERLTNAVENGRIDQAEADQKSADAEARITDMVNNGRPERGAPDAED
jgi:hypothetical protein